MSHCRSVLRALCVLGAAIVACLAAACEVEPLPFNAGTVFGRVMLDHNGDGVISRGDAPLAGALVAYETDRFTVTDADGRFALDLPAAGLVWVLSPDGAAPGPHWRAVARADQPLELAIAEAPALASGPLSFGLASDPHVDNVREHELLAALTAVAHAAEGLAFVALTGDLMSRSESWEMERLEAMFAALPVPVVPVPGNHDWHDDGAVYRAALGPDMYAFNAGGYRFVVLNFMRSAWTQIEFLRAVLAEWDGPSAVLVHAPPGDDVRRAAAELGASLVMSGHIHANRSLRRESVLELSTQPLVMGGLDYTPAGYRVVTLDGAQVRAEHHALVQTPVARLTGLPETGCLSPGRQQLLATLELGAAPRRVSLALDGRELGVRSVGGSSWSATAHLAAGQHHVRLQVDTADGRALVDDRVLCASLEPAGAASPEPQRLWTAALGGWVRSGSLRVAGGRVYAAVADLADGRAGGVVALDAGSGRRVWQRRLGASVPGPVGIGDGLVVAAADDASVHAFEAATGAPRWQRDLGAGLSAEQGWVFGGVSVRDGRAFVTVRDRRVALTLATGVLAWEHSDDVLPGVSVTSPSVGAHIGVAVAGRNQINAWDPVTGVLRWRYARETARPVQASPIVAEGRVFAIDERSRLVALEAATGALVWRRALYDQDEPALGLEPVGTPVVADGRVIVATPQEGVAAFSADSGAPLWRASPGGASPLHPVAYATVARGATAAPLVLGDTVWLGGLDGTLWGLDVATGATRWSVELGSPVLAGIASDGSRVFIATFDGAVHAFATP